MSFSSPVTALRPLAQELAPVRGRRSARFVTPVLGVAVGAVVVFFVSMHAHEFLSAMERAMRANWALAAAGAVFEVASLGGYVLLMHRVIAPASQELSLADSYDITLAGTAATRLLPTAGLGGAAVTVWALRARGVATRELVERLIAFLLLLYGVYMAALAGSGVVVAFAEGRGIGFAGIGLGVGIAALAIGVAFAPARLVALLPGRVREQSPVLRSGFGRAYGELRHPHPALLGALAWWAFDIAVLAVMLHAFGAGVSPAALVLAYFLGTMFNVLPLPGSLSGGLVGALLALGAPAAPAIAAVLAYRAVAVWLPALTGLASVGRLRSSVAQWRAEAG